MREQLKVKEVGSAELSAEECVAAHLVIVRLLRLYRTDRSPRKKRPISQLPVPDILGIV